MKQVYDIEAKIKESLKQFTDPAGHFETDILPECPYERRFLFPGKLYVFKYKPAKEPKKPYDAKPYIMSLGPDKEKPGYFYGMDMHHMPYRVRVQFFVYVYKMFEPEIQREIAERPDVSDVQKQKYITAVTSENIVNVPFNLKPSIHRYNIMYMSECRTVNYNLVHLMLQDDVNRFKNGTIAEAQEEFMKANLKR